MGDELPPGGRRSPLSPRAAIVGCTALGAALLFTMVLARFFLAHNYQDFPQFYMGGLVARHGAWGDLYPIPIPGSERNPGEPGTGRMRPEYARLAAQAGVHDSLRFIQAPPVALLFYPFAFLSFKAAHLAWTIASVVFGVIVAWQAGAVYARLAGRTTMAQGLVVLLVAASPNMYQSCRMGQVSTLIGVGFGAAILGLSGPERSGAGTGFGLFLASLKFAGPVLAPVALAMRRWRTLLWAASLGLALGAASIAITGLGPWERWVTDIAPTLSRSHEWAANQSVHGMIMRLYDSHPPPALTMALKGASAAVLLAILALMFTRRRAAWGSKATVFAACAALLAWLHVFSPIFWNHYYPYVFPLWGWLAWEATRSRAMGACVLGVFALAWVPVSVIPGLATRVPEPARTHMLFSAVLLLGMALWRLAHPPIGEAPPASVDPAASRRGRPIC